MRNHLAGIVFAAAIVATLNPVAVRADDADDCVNAPGAERQIRACTRVIENGDYARRDLAWAYHNRALAHYNRDDYEESLLDLVQVLSIDPGFRRAYLDRANAKCMLRQGRTAIDDYQRAIDFDAIDKKREWQRFLKDRGYYRGGIDGDFGTNSRRAMMAWARDSCF